MVRGNNEGQWGRGRQGGHDWVSQTGKEKMEGESMHIFTIVLPYDPPVNKKLRCSPNME